MDYQNLLPLVLAIVAIVPTILSLITQASKDKKQAAIDMNKAATDAMMSVIQPMRDEITRLQTRGVELEGMLIDKTTENGNLRIKLIDKENEIRALKYNYDGLQIKLDALQGKGSFAANPTSTPSKKKKKEETLPITIKQEIEANELRKQQIAQETDDVLKEIKSKSVTNGTTKPEGEQNG